MEIYPSLISSDLLCLSETIEKIDPLVDGYHIDVMDFHFVPNLTWGPAFVHALHRITTKPFELHLMIDQPEKWCKAFKLRSNDYYIFHREALDDDRAALDLCKRIKASGSNVGVALNPQTPPHSVFPLLFCIDTVLIMSVNPGFSGQKFIPSVMEKVLPIRDRIQRNDYNVIIGMDGGIGCQSISSVSRLGVDRVAMASALFSTGEVVSRLNYFKELVSR